MNVNIAISFMAFAVSALSLFQSTKISTLRAQLDVFKTYQIQSRKATDWADHFLEISSYYMHICEHTNDIGREEYVQKRIKVLAKLTALMESGRWYFPNIKYKEVDTDKKYAYKGRKSFLLKEIRTVIETVKAMTYDQYKQSCLSYQSQINEAHRSFVSFFQKWLLVRENNKLREDFFKELVDDRS